MQCSNMMVSCSPPILDLALGLEEYISDEEVCVCERGERGGPDGRASGGGDEGGGWGGVI